MFADLLSYATGLDIDETELTRVAKRTQSLVRGYNVREGLRRKDDTVPEFYFHKKPPAHFTHGVISSSGPVKKTTEGQVLDRSLFNKWIDRFYQLKGWNSDGILTKETLNELGLDYVRQDLEHRGILTNGDD